MDFSKRLAQIREIRGLSQAAMAKDVNSSLSAWQGYESGKNTPGGKVLESLAKMGFNINWLLTGVGPKKLQEEEIRRALCEEAHQELKDYLRRKIPISRHWITDIPGVPCEQVEAYVKGTHCLKKEQLVSLCLHVKHHFDKNDFIDKITSCDLTKPTKLTPNKTDLAYIADKFKKVRNGTDIDSFAFNLNITVDELLAIENEQLEPSISVLSLLCFEYDINAEWLIENEGPIRRGENRSKEIYLDTKVLEDILVETEVYESIHPGALTSEKKAQLIAELYERRVAKSVERHTQKEL